MVMNVNWDKAIDMLVKDWDKLTRGKKSLDIIFTTMYRSGIGKTYDIALYRSGRGWLAQGFETAEDAQKWLAGQLSDMIEEEFRRQVAQQAAEEERM
jgi:hypothetical protein